LTLRFTADVFPRFSSIHTDLLPFIERAQSGAPTGDMNKHVLAATAFRLNKSVALVD
jgi:hypothetical protein